MFAYGFLPRVRFLLVVVETHATSIMSVASVAGDLDAGVRARRVRHTIAISLVTDVCNVKFTYIFARFTCVLFEHGKR